MVQSSKLLYFIIFVLSSALLAAVSYFVCDIDSSGYVKRCLFAYNNPLVILAALSLLLLFQQTKIQSSIINWAAASCFAIYLITENINVRELYFEHANALYVRGPFFSSFLLLMLYVLAVFVLSILIDQVRKFVWSKIEQKIPEVYFKEIQ